MRKVLPLLIALAFLLSTIGCLTTSSFFQGFYSTRYQDWQPGTNPPREDNFGPGDIPALYVYGFDQETVTLEFTSLASGKSWRTDPIYIPKNKVWLEKYPDLASGSYSVILLVRNTGKATCTFSVENPTAARLTGLLVFNKWVDINADSAPQKEEFFGLGKADFNLSKDSFGIAFIPQNTSAGELTIQLWTSAGSLIRESKFGYVQSSSFLVMQITPNAELKQGDLLADLKKAGPGSYRIIAVSNHVTYSVDINVEE